MLFFKLTKIFLVIQISLLIIAIIWRYFAFFEANEWAWGPLQMHGTLIWASFLIASTPWIFYIIYAYYKEYQYIWNGVQIDKIVWRLVKLSYYILILSLINIIIFTINFENLNGRIDSNGKWINIYQRLYPNCQVVPPDLKVYYSKDCKLKLHE